MASLSDLLARIAEQDAMIAILKGALAADGAELPDLSGAWEWGLTAQQSAVLGVLMRVYPHAVLSEDIGPRMPGRYHDREDVSPNAVSVAICYLRKALGRDSIQTRYGGGYRLSDAFFSSLKAKAAA